MENVPHSDVGSLTIPPELTDTLGSLSHIQDYSQQVKTYTTENTTNLLDVVLLGAITLKASDVHVEPEKEAARLRVRIDGILQDTGTLPLDAYHHLLSRVKLLSKIKLNVTGKPQDGRFTISSGKTLIEVRTSTLPAEFGESIVMRILNPEGFMSLETLGLRKDLYALIATEIQKPNGMIAVTGPTGSGKTTTLYAMLSKIKTPDVKIITIEDPIEYHVAGIEQTQVAADKGYTFAEGLKSIVRQDPDVILVGEIRDTETAGIALQASLTGHLVFTTLHTNDAAGTVPRLVDLGEHVSSIAPALKMMIGQRLVRKVCSKCSTLEKPSATELAEIKKGLKHLPKSVTIPSLDSLHIARANEKGCAACNFTGYQGRKGLYEICIIDEHMAKFILKNPPTSDLKAMAIKQGMVTMWQSGLIEVIHKETTLDEVKRVVEADE